MKKYLLALLTVFTLALAGCANGEGNTANNQNAGENQEAQQPKEVTIEFSKETVDFEAGETLMEVMEREYDLTLDESGQFIVGIDGIESDTENSYFWTYTINNEEVLVGANEYKMEEDDVVTFNYSKWE